MNGIPKRESALSIKGEWDRLGLSWDVVVNDGRTSSVYSIAATVDDVLEIAEVLFRPLNLGLGGIK